MRYELAEGDLRFLLEELKWEAAEHKNNQEHRPSQRWFHKEAGTPLRLTWARGRKGTASWDVLELLDATGVLRSLSEIHDIAIPRLMALAYRRHLLAEDIDSSADDRLRRKASVWTNKGRGLVVHTAGIGGQHFAVSFGSVFDDYDPVARQNLADEGAVYSSPGRALAAFGENWDADLTRQAFFLKLGR